MAAQTRRAFCTTGALNSTTITLPKDPLQKGKVSLDGTISVIDQKQAVVANIVLHANIS